MKDHKQALYIRKPGDKFRALRIARPTLRQVEAKLRVAVRKIKSLEKLLKEGQQEPPLLVMLRRHCDGLKAYLANIGKEFQGELPKSTNLRLGPSVA